MAAAKRQRDPLEPRFEQGLGNVEAPVGEERGAADGHGLPRMRQRVDEYPVPQQDEQQHRGVAGELDVAVRQARHQPVFRQPEYPDEEAEHGGHDDAEEGHQSRVDQPHHRRAQVRVPVGVLDERLVDVVVGGEPEEFEPEGLVEDGEVGDDVGDHPGHGREHAEQHQDLDGDAADGLVVPQAAQAERRTWGRTGSVVRLHHAR